jgi:hypothetical protein
MRFGALIGVTLLTAAVTAGCIRTATTPGRNCEPSGRERYVVQVDGIVMGMFEEYTLTGTTAVFRRGVLPPGDFVNDWRQFNSTNPLVTEEHDITVLTMIPVVDRVLSQTELVASRLIDVQGEPAHDRADCLLVDSLTVRAGEIRAPSGVVTGIH